MVLKMDALFLVLLLQLYILQQPEGMFGEDMVRMLDILRVQDTLLLDNGHEGMADIHPLAYYILSNLK
jgi:hypothetical protein